ncbi:DNA primase family protein [Mycolicibacterium smegmatis]|uniref:DNA primase family protein n=1 Tax=Mycolicibacterium smegmatis TaxID=1772 RepID=UPI001EFA2D31|nr:phage/plasmid primase, P4 family [Mycolicibacterium smegmatis]ULN32593.1 hypothetical protein KZ781_16880 [Mycolicibacterium smegmatis]
MTNTATSERDSTGSHGNGHSGRAEHISGEHYRELLGLDYGARLSAVLTENNVWALVDWHTQRIAHYRNPDPYLGTETRDPRIDDLPVIPVDQPGIAEALADRGVTAPTRAEVIEWTKDTAHDADDPETELWRADNLADPDLVALTTDDQNKRSICGIKGTIFDALGPAEQDMVRAGKVIPAPQAPTYAARWLARQHFAQRVLVSTGKRRRRAWMRTVVRVDQTWYEYARATAGDPPRWVARTDPEWMRGRLRAVLEGMYYLKSHTEKGVTIYDGLKAWNPDDRSLIQVENALADRLNVGSGTTARAIPDLYGRTHNVYPASGTWALTRNGVLDVTTRQLRANTPLWFSLSRIEADYDPSVNYEDSEWLRMLRTQWPNDPGAIVCLQQWFGYVLSGRTDLQKWMLIIGPTGSGKSIIADVLAALSGAVTATKLDDLNSGFGLQSLYEDGAGLALLSDIRFSSRDSSTAVGNLLAIIGEDDVTVSRKYKAAVSTKLGVRFHGSANELPRWSDNSNALARRALILETSRAFRGTNDDDPGLKRRILEGELGAVLRWAVDGLALLDAAGGTFTVSERAADLHAELADLSSSVRTFFGECCEIGSAEDYVDLAELFAVWRKWAEQNNTGKGMSQNKFQSAIRSLYLDSVRVGQKKRPDGKPGKWMVVWGVKRAEARYTDRTQYGTTTRTVSTDPIGDPLGDGNRRGPGLN